MGSRIEIKGLFRREVLAFEVAWLGGGEQAGVLEHFVGKDGEEGVGVDEEDAIILFEIRLVLRSESNKSHSPFPQSYSESPPRPQFP